MDQGERYAEASPSLQRLRPYGSHQPHVPSMRTVISISQISVLRPDQLPPSLGHRISSRLISQMRWVGDVSDQLLPSQEKRRGQLGLHSTLGLVLCLRQALKKQGGVGPVKTGHMSS